MLNDRSGPRRPRRNATQTGPSAHALESCNDRLVRSGVPSTQQTPQRPRLAVPPSDWGGAANRRPSHFHQPAVDEVDQRRDLHPHCCHRIHADAQIWPLTGHQPTSTGGPPGVRFPSGAAPSAETRVATRSPNTNVAGESLRQAGGEFDERQPGLLLQRGEIEVWLSRRCLSKGMLFTAPTRGDLFPRCQNS